MKNIILLGILTSLSFTAEAKLIQIIHTNDLHSYFEGTKTGKGGYARLKTMVERLRADAKNRDIPSLYLDGGDFGEGSSFFVSGKGQDSLKALDLLGIDATVLGNHDYMLGGPELAIQMKESKLRTPILSSNLKGKDKLGLKDLIQDYKDFDLDGLKVRVFGVSTPEVHGQYQLKPLGKIGDPVDAGLKILKEAKNHDVDFVISLSHTGIEEDQKLVKKSDNLGLVVGGHDHLKFVEPRFEKNKKGHQIPILQAGAQSLAVGSMILDIDSKGLATIVSYKLHEVTPEIPADENLVSFVDQARIKRDAFFGRSWSEIIGYSEIVLTGRIEGRMKKNRSCWSRHLARAAKDAVGADVGLQLDGFQSDEIPAGPISFGNIIDNFSHISSWDPRGWEIVVMKLRGSDLKLVMDFLSKDKNELSATFDGVYVENTDKSLTAYHVLNHKPGDAHIKGRKIRPMERYSIALPGEVVLALQRAVPIIGKYLFGTVKLTEKQYYWPSIETYIRRHSPIRCMDDQLLKENEKGDVL